tara:strand:- start:8 stop:403 length:396 start_codon:yes stop_codon:yes gene_type:complete
MKIKLQNLVSITESNVGNKRDKIQHGFYKEIAVLHGNGSSPCRFRFYNTGQTIHCCAWISGTKVYSSGYGKAGGYGYCRESAAMYHAIKDGGITMSEHWAGVGDSKMREAAIDIAKKVTGKRVFRLHVAHS